ncbi:hypothetical protein ML8HA_01623 [Lactococcus lactis]|nr:hypothetical protein [Lactococcus lactis]
MNWSWLTNLNSVVGAWLSLGLHLLFVDAGSKHSSEYTLSTKT